MNLWKKFFVKTQAIQYFDQDSLFKTHQYYVKTMYRTFLKKIPSLYERNLLIQQKLKEVQWTFREAKDEKCPETIKYYKDIGEYVLKQMENKSFPPFPQHYPNPLKTHGIHLDIFKRKLLTQQKY